jgi:LPXTG-site transpeptidase (sortase) family protein
MSLVIPKLFINAPIDPVGLNTKGEMATSPSLQRLAWYKDGAAPGQIGSAVFAGHYGGPNEIGVFRSLDQLKNGDVLEVKSKAGKIQKYSVYNIGKYALADVPLQELFNKNDGKYLNLVTCVGTWSNGTSSYDQRYIVFSRLVE